MVLQRAQVGSAATPALRAAEAERDAANAQAARLQTELQRATETLQYMERLLKALKQQKAATAEAEARQAEATACVGQLQTQLTDTQVAAAEQDEVLREQRGTIAQLQGEVEACERTKQAHARLLVHVLVSRAVSKAAAAEARGHEKDIAQLRKGLRAALAKLDKAREEAQACKADVSSRGKQQAQMEQAAMEMQTQLDAKGRTIEDLEASVAQLTGRLQAEREALAALQEGRVQAEARRDKDARDFEARARAHADECASRAVLQRVRVRCAALSEPGFRAASAASF